MSSVWDEYTPLSRIDGPEECEEEETPHRKTSRGEGGVLGVYQPDRSRKISRVPAFMEVLREADRKTSVEKSLWTDAGRVIGQAYRATEEVLAAKFGRFSQRSTDLCVPSHEDIVDQGRLLCKEYVNSRLKRNGLLPARKATGDGIGGAQQLVITSSSQTSDELQAIGGELERMYPDLYKNVSRQLNMTMSSEEVVRKTYLLFAEHLCSGQMYWGKIVALLAMAGAFAVECSQQGHPEYVPKVVDAFSGFVARNLVGWIARQGGWVVSDVVRNMKRVKEHSWFWILGTFGALIGFVLTLLFMISI